MQLLHAIATEFAGSTHAPVQYGAITTPRNRTGLADGLRLPPTEMLHQLVPISPAQVGNFHSAPDMLLSATGTSALGAFMLDVGADIETVTGAAQGASDRLERALRHHHYGAGGEPGHPRA